MRWRGSCRMLTIWSSEPGSSWSGFCALASLLNPAAPAMERNRTEGRTVLRITAGTEYIGKSSNWPLLFFVVVEVSAICRYCAPRVNRLRARSNHRLRVLRSMPDEPCPMDFAVAGKILVDARRRTVFHPIFLLHFRIHPEAAVVVGEDQQAVLLQSCHAQVDQFLVVALDIENIVCAFGVREGRRIQEDQIKTLAATLQKGQAVTLNQLVSTLVDPVELKIARGPVQVGAGHVDTGRRAGAAEGSMHRSRGGVAKQIEEAGVTGVCLKPQPDRAMVEEQPGVQVALQV